MDKTGVGEKLIHEEVCLLGYKTKKKYEIYVSNKP